MLNDGVCRATTDKQTHKHTNKHTYRVKTEETFFTLKFFLLFSFKKAVSNYLDNLRHYRTWFLHVLRHTQPRLQQGQDCHMTGI